ncbi:serine protease [Pseudonocardiaceae bacterium YIM PH 21723]|nr:serine protease [Pseudonocardiaceae bacterium YIM PH 21723]
MYLVKSIVAALALVMVTGGVAQADEPPTLEGAVGLSNCSGSVIRLTTSEDEDPAMVLTNGHCTQQFKPKPGYASVNQPIVRDITVLDAEGNAQARAKTTKLLYATLTGTDIGLYQLDKSYDQLSSEGAKIFELAPEHPHAGQGIHLIAGHEKWKKTWACSVERFVYELREEPETQRDSLRYAPGCQTGHGTSGSPLIDPDTDQVIGVHNTGNDDGQQCTNNNPCEVDEQGNITVHHNQKYGQQTYQLYGCLAEHSEIDLSRAECALTKAVA